MRQVIVGGKNNDCFGAATEYNCLMGGGNWNATENTVYQCMPTGGTLGSLFINLSGNVAAGATATFTVMIAGAPSTLTCTVPAGSASASDTTHFPAVAAGQVVSIRCTYTGAPGVLWARWASVFEGSMAGESICLIHCNNRLVGTNHSEIQGYNNDRILADQSVAPMPTSGIFRKLYVALSADPGSAPDAYSITLVKNGVPTTLTCTIVANNTTGNNVANDVATVADDLVRVAIAPIDTPTVLSEVAIGMVFVATTSGESLIIGGPYDITAGLGTTEYNNLCTSGQAWTATEANAYSLIQGCTIRSLYVKLTIAPGGVATQTISIRLGGGASGLTVTITGAATTGNDVINTATPTDGQTCGIRIVPSAAALATYCFIGLVCYCSSTISETETGVGTDGLGVVYEDVPATTANIYIWDTITHHFIRYDIIKGSLRIDYTLSSNGRSSASFAIPDLAEAYSFVPRLPVQIYDIDWNLLHNGFIARARIVRVSPDGGRIWELTTVNQSYIINNRVAYCDYVATSCGDIVRDLIARYLFAEGITEGTIDSDAMLATYTAEYVKISEILDYLASQANCIWLINEARELSFFDPATNNAPWILTSDDVSSIPPASCELVEPQYRNVQYVKDFTLGAAPPSPNTDWWESSGDRFYLLSHQPTAFISITEDGAPKTFGVWGVDTGRDWYWQPDGLLMFTENPPAPGVIIVFTYTPGAHRAFTGWKGEYLLVGVSHFPPDVDTNWITMGENYLGFSGLVEDVLPNSEVDEQDAQLIVAFYSYYKYAPDGKILTFTTEREGLEVGQLLEVNLPVFNVVSEDFLIDSISLRATMGRRIYEVKAVYVVVQMYVTAPPTYFLEGGASLSAWLRYYKSLQGPR